MLPLAVARHASLGGLAITARPATARMISVPMVAKFRPPLAIVFVRTPGLAIAAWPVIFGPTNVKVAFSIPFPALVVAVTLTGRDMTVTHAVLMRSSVTVAL